MGTVRFGGVTMASAYGFRITVTGKGGQLDEHGGVHVLKYTQIAYEINVPSMASACGRSGAHRRVCVHPVAGTGYPARIDHAVMRQAACAERRTRWKRLHARGAKIEPGRAVIIAALLHPAVSPRNRQGIP